MQRRNASRVDFKAFFYDSVAICIEGGSAAAEHAVPASHHRQAIGRLGIASSS
ncbi:hypothetical protein [Mesorhizobium sp. M0814]|uniref:hypothetical protein n=1 Tax=unclassified Mesorhizobium TaxID=325217 RepID=UPI00333DB44E